MYYNNRDVRLENIPVPEISRDEILVKVKAGGICGSDVLEWYRVKRAPLVLGHEITGVIEKVGERARLYSDLGAESRPAHTVVGAGGGVTKYKPGQRVFVSHHVPCNKCRYCLKGHHTACETLHTTNYFPGGFSEYIRVPAINVKHGIFVLPDEISFEEGTFIEPLACVVRGQRLAGFKSGETVVILGSGISGILHLLLARARGAKRVIMTDVNKYRMEAAKRFGADAVINAGERVPDKIRELNEGVLADLVIVCTGALPAFKQALECADRGGTILFFAATEPGVTVPVPANEFWRNEMKLLTSYANSPDDAREAIELIKSGIVKVRGMITHRLSLEEARKGFGLVAEAKDSIKVILAP